MGNWEEILGEAQLLSPCMVLRHLSWTRATSCCHTHEAAVSCQAPHQKHQRGLFNSAFCPLSLGWLYSLTELGRVKRQHTHRRDLHTSEPQPEQTPQVTLETPSSGTLTAPSKSVCSKIISPASLLSWWSSLLFEVSYWLKTDKTRCVSDTKSSSKFSMGAEEYHCTHR